MQPLPLHVIVIVLASVSAAIAAGLNTEESNALVLTPKSIYSVEHCADPAFNGFYICGSIGHCDHTSGEASLVAVHKFINNSIQKVWYLKNTTTGTNAYGSIERSAIPWITHPWKKIKGSVEPLLTVQPLDMEVCHKDRVERVRVREAVRGLWLVLFALPRVPHARNTLALFQLLADHTGGCVDLLLETVLGMLERGKAPPSEAVAVLCDWIHLAFGWSSHAVTCFHYITLQATTPTATASAASAAATPPTDHIHAETVLLSSLREVHQYRPGGGVELRNDGSESHSAPEPEPELDRTDELPSVSHPRAHTDPVPVPASCDPICDPICDPDIAGISASASALSSPTIHLHMTPMSCFQTPLGATGSGSDAVGGASTAASLKPCLSNSYCHRHCILQYSLLQYSRGLLKYEFNPRESVKVLRILQSPTDIKGESAAGSYSYDAIGKVKCVELVLEYLAGDFVDYSALKGEFQRGECFASCQSLALTPSSVKTPPLVHVDTRYSSVADSLRLACYTLNKRDSPQDSSMEVDDLITMTNSLLAIGAVVSASDVGRAAFQNYFNINGEDAHRNAEICNWTPAGKASQFSSRENDRLRALYRLSYLFNRTAPEPTPTAHATTCVEDVKTRLTNGDWKTLRSSPQLFSFYLSLTLQVHSVEMLASRHEASVAKRLLAREMRTVAEVCEVAGDCAVDLDLLTPAVRGLFLLAYQGEEYTPSEEVDYDWSIPHSYYRTLRASHSHALSSLPAHSSLFMPDAILPMQAHAKSQFPSDIQQNDTRIRVAFLSAYFFRHSVGRLMGNMILSLNRNHFHVTVLCARKAKLEEGNKVKDDDLTTKFKQGVDTWVDLSLSFSRDVTIIRELNSDVLVFGDLLMHALTAHLASQRMAPLQVAFWGHPFSAASTTIDYFISSDGFQESWSSVKKKRIVSTEYFEQLVLMESFSADVLADRGYESGSTLDDVFQKHHYLGTRTAYVEYVMSRGHDLFSRPFQYGWHNHTRVEHLHLYTCLQSSMKMHPLFDEILVELLLKDSHAIIILLSSLKAKFLPQLKFQQRLLRALLRAGADPTRILFMPQIPSVVYSQVVCGADVTLDPAPFGGGVTLSDSVRCNVPFITSGPLQRVHRLGHGMAQQLELPLMTADNATTYVTHAMTLATEVSQCRQHVTALQGEYSTCLPIDSDEPLVLSTCGVRHTLCDRKLLLYGTGDIDFGGTKAQRNAVTEEWERFMTRIVKASR